VRTDDSGKIAAAHPEKLLSRILLRTEVFMKNRIAGGTAGVGIGALIAAGPQSLFRICEQSHHATTSTCYWTAQAAIGIGIITALIGIVYFFFQNAHVRAGLSIAIGLNAVLLLLVANVLIGMDDMAMMACRLKTLPALNIISVLTLALAGVNTFYLLRLKKGGGGVGEYARTDVNDLSYSGQ
jgi:hypothetical protein